VAGNARERRPELASLPELTLLTGSGAGGDRGDGGYRGQRDEDRADDQLTVADADELATGLLAGGLGDLNE